MPIFYAECDPNEVFHICGTACPITCDNLHNPPRVCPRQCVSKCFCKEGFFRDTRTNKCVPKDQCPKTRKIFPKLSTQPKNPFLQILLVDPTKYSRPKDAKVSHAKTTKKKNAFS